MGTIREDYHEGPFSLARNIRDSIGLQVPAKTKVAPTHTGSTHASVLLKLAVHRSSTATQATR